MDISGVARTAIPMLMQLGLKVVGAIALWRIGRWLIGFAVSVLSRSATDGPR